MPDETSFPIMVLLAGWAAAAGVMLVLWVGQLRSGDAGIVDVGWAALLGLLAVGFALTVDAPPLRRWLVGLLAGSWSLRLALYLLFNRVLAGAEDGRYQKLRAEKKDHLQTFFFIFFQAQGLLAVILAIPFLVCLLKPDPALTWTDALAVSIWIISVIGEWTSDRQLARFRADPASRGKTCRAGLWRYSRHPNYFFQSLFWWTFVALGIDAPFGWLTLISPVVILFLILKVTGIPPTEEQALLSRGDDYRAYQRTTSALVPWFPREDPGPPGVKP